ncbi:MAG: RsmB/NOP family class I SAM-dependent RNA methyltransferase [Rhodothermales bacterium]
MALPSTFLERLRRILPEDRFEAALHGMTAPRATSFRVNPLRADAARVDQALDAAQIPFHRVDWLDGAGWIEPAWREALMALPAYADRWIYVQNLSSMLPPIALAPRPGERVLDLAAAPGSKTLQIAGMMRDGELAAVEAVKHRFMRLKRNLSEHGAEWVRTFLQDGTRVWKYRPEYFDRVLLDAPCSSEGRFHVDDPESFAYWSERKIAEMERKQRQLLFSAIQCLRPGGILVYSTCSLAPEENEAVVDRMLRRFGDALTTEALPFETPEMTEPLPAWGKRTFDPAVAAGRRVVPTERTEGFYLCVIRKRESTMGTKD